MRLALVTGSTSFTQSLSAALSMGRFDLGLSRQSTASLQEKAFLKARALLRTFRGAPPIELPGSAQQRVEIRKSIPLFMNDMRAPSMEGAYNILTNESNLFNGPTCAAAVEMVLEYASQSDPFTQRNHLQRLLAIAHNRDPQLTMPVSRLITASCLHNSEPTGD